MAKVIVNLTAKMAEQEIDKQLTKIPAALLQNIHAPLDLHRSLVMYVLKRLPNHYTVLEDPLIPDTDYEELGATAENRGQIADLINQGIYCLLNDSDLPEITASPTSAASCTPSSWFG